MNQSDALQSNRLPKSLLKSSFLGLRKLFTTPLVELLPKELSPQQQIAILWPILVGSLLLALFAHALALFSAVEHYVFTTGNQPERLPITTFLIVFILGLLYLVKRRRTQLSGEILVIALGIICLFASLSYGVATPQPILTFGLLILMSGAVTNPRFTLFYTIATIASLSIVYYLHSHEIVPLQNTWDNGDTTWGDLILFAITFALFFLVTFLFSRENQRSLITASTYQKQRVEIQPLVDLGRRTGGILHDLSDPISVLSLNLSEVKQHFIDHTIPDDDLVAQMQYALRQIETHIQGMRSELKKDTKPEDFSIDTEIQNVIKLLEYSARRKHVQIQYTPCNLTLHTQRGNFFRVVQNLVSNAIAAYPESGNHLPINIWVDQVKANQIHCNIQDYGTGIRPKDQPHIFTPFFTTKKSGEGSGLGLTTSLEIVRTQLLGDIGFSSSSKGTLFSLMIPQSLQHVQRTRDTENLQLDTSGIQV